MLLLGTSFFYSSTASAVSTGPATITCANSAGEQRTWNVQWDNSVQYFADKGDIAAHFCTGGYGGQYNIFVTTSVTDLSLRYYNGVLPAPSAPAQETTTVVSETQTTVSSQDSQTVTDSQTSVSDTSSVVSLTPETQTATSDSQTVLSDTSTAVLDTQTVVVESQTSTTQVETPTSVVVDTQTSLSDTATSTQPIQQQTPVDTIVPSPAPEPVRPEPVVVPEPQPEPQPEPVVEQEIVPEPEPEQPVEDLTPVEDIPLEEEPVQDTPEPEPLPVEPDPVEQDIDNSDSASDQPSVVPAEPAPSLPVESPQPPTSEPMVTLDNGVIIAEEVAVALAVLDNPAELLSQIFTDPRQVLLALANVGADMSPEARERSEEVIISAVIAGNIATQAAATAGAAAAYRRKP